MNILEQEEFNQSDIQAIIDTKLEESINIDFKSAAALSEDKMVKKEISKDVSSFANSDGGIIFYGIDEKDHVASGISFVDGSKYTKEWIENVIISNIQQRIDGIKIIPVRFYGMLNKTVYIIKIPKSLSSPHINGDKKYYKRFNFQSVPMEEYEIRSGYLTPNDSAIEFHDLVFGVVEQEYYKYRINFDIQMINQSKVVSNSHKVALSFSFENRGLAKGLAIESNNDHVISRYTHGLSASTKIDSRIFPNEILTVLQLSVEIKEDNFQETLSNLTSTLKVFSNNRYQEKDLMLGKIFKNMIKKEFGI